MLAQRMDEAIDESRVRGLAEGTEQGLAEGTEQQRTMLLRLAARKADTAARFEALLAAPPPAPAHRVLFLDGVMDPRNLGGILRTSEAMGVRDVVVPKDRAAGVTATVIKASAGAAHHLEVYRVSNLSRGLLALRDKGYWLVGLDARAASGVCGTAYPEKLAVVLGGEGRGIRPLVRRSCDYLVSIPMQGRTGSLNVGVAWGIFAYELTKHRTGAVSARPR